MTTKIKKYFDPELKGFSSPCDLTRIIGNILVWTGIIVVIAFASFTAGLPVSTPILNWLVPGQVPCPLWGYIFIIICGILTMIVVILVILIGVELLKWFADFLDTIYTNHVCVPIKTVKKKLKWCQIKVFKIDHNEVAR